MTQPSIKELQTHLQASLNFLELCRALKRRTRDPHVKEALNLLIDGEQESLAILSSHLRQMRAAPGARELDRRGKARIREVLALRSPGDQLLAVRRSLADLVAWYETHPPTAQADPATRDLLASLSAQAHRMLEGWDRHLDEMKVAK